MKMNGESLKKGKFDHIFVYISILYFLIPTICYIVLFNFIYPKIDELDSARPLQNNNQ